MMPGESVSATHRYIFMMKLSAQSSPKATREGEEERRVIETRALLSGPFLPTTRRQAEKEKKRASDRRRRKKRGHRCKWSVKQKIEETAAIPPWTTQTQRKGDKRNLDCLVRSRSPFTCCLSCAHTHTHTDGRTRADASRLAHTHRKATCLRNKRPRWKSLRWSSSWACRRCWWPWWPTTGPSSAHV